MAARSELFLELISEEIPPGMQEQAARDLLYLVMKALEDLASSPLENDAPACFSSARRIGCALTLDSQLQARIEQVRGPKISAPKKAVEGFARKQGVKPEDLKEENGYYVLDFRIPRQSAEKIIQARLPDILWNFPWPKSMKWGASAFSWIRPLHQITCVLDGKPVIFSLARGDDDAHGLKSQGTSCGNIHGNEKPFKISSYAQWQKEMAKRDVIPFPKQRRERIEKLLQQEAKRRDVTRCPDPGLISEVSGMAEKPFVLVGKIAPKYMELPPEVRNLAMRKHQRFFAFENEDGTSAPYFAFVTTGEFARPETIIAGNERVLQARLEDALYFWDLDRKKSLESRVPELKQMVFQENLGTQWQRAKRLAKLCGFISAKLELSKTRKNQAERAAYLAKADLLSGMVGEFPELQGIMGSYYAQHDGEAPAVCQAIREQYQPKDSQDKVPTSHVSVVLGLADRIDQLTGFFLAGLEPTGRGDPYGLRRAALGIIRMIRTNGLSLNLQEIFDCSINLFSRQRYERRQTKGPSVPYHLASFLLDRIRVILKQEGINPDLLTGLPHLFDIHDIFTRVETLHKFLKHEEGKNLLAAVKRAANIVDAELLKGWNLKNAIFNRNKLIESSEKNLISALEKTEKALHESSAPDLQTSLEKLSALSAPVNAFFETVHINTTEDPELRDNRLTSLHIFRELVYKYASQLDLLK